MTGRRTPVRVAFIALAVAMLAALLPAATAAAASPRIVLIVGPVGGLTETYRDLARAGAREARRYTDDVVEVYSPDATWPRVRAALRGASVVVYLGHGNGFPSPYGNRLRPAVQDGFGLNPVAGRGDGTHQYFGEGLISDQVRLAPGAVVLLFRLCYASGLSEPGVPEGSESTARQRVDNYAAGFLAAGASAVIADAYASPATYIRALLGSSVSARTAWTRSGTANGNVRSFASERTAGAVALMDPERATSGFARSIVLAAGAAGAAGGVVPSVPGRGSTVPPGGWEVVVPPVATTAPEAFTLGARPGAAALEGNPLAGSTVRLHLPVAVTTDAPLRSDYRLGVRWVPLDDPTTPVEPVAGDLPADVAIESAASLVEVTPATTTGNFVSAPVSLPAASGRYRLEITVHDRDGVALPYAVQAAIPGLVVHVGGPGAAWLDAPPALSITAATQASVQVVVTNGEAEAWGSCPGAPAPSIVPGSLLPVASPVLPIAPAALGEPAALAAPGASPTVACPTVRLVGRWVPVGGTGTAAPMTSDLAIPAGGSVATWLAGPVPAQPGTYLLVASVERTGGSGTAGEPAAVEVLGRPVIITVEVTAAPLVPLLPVPGGPTPAPDPYDPLSGGSAPRG